MKEIKEERWTAAKYIKDNNGSILDFTGKYEVSDTGKVRSLNYRCTGKTVVLKQHTFECKDGTIYYQVLLRKDNKRHILPTHRLVLSSFKMSEYFPNAVVNHIEARSEICDNSLANLEWITQQQNVSTEHRKELLTKVLTNHPTNSKRVSVTDLATCEVTEYPSTREAERILNLPKGSITAYINQQNGCYKKRQLHFKYV